MTWDDEAVELFWFPDDPYQVVASAVVKAPFLMDAQEKGRTRKAIAAALDDGAQIGVELMVPAEVKGCIWSQRVFVGQTGRMRSKVLLGGEELSWKAAQMRVREEILTLDVPARRPTLRNVLSSMALAGKIPEQVFSAYFGTRRDGCWREQMRKTLTPEVRVTNAKWRVCAWRPAPTQDVPPLFIDTPTF